MKILYEMRLRDFEFWAGAVDRVEHLTWEQLDVIEEVLTDMFPDGIDDTTVNDLFWFDEDIIAEWLGYNSFDELVQWD